jgi:hypothetical protein
MKTCRINPTGRKAGAAGHLERGGYSHYGPIDRDRRLDIRSLRCWRDSSSLLKPCMGVDLRRSDLFCLAKSLRPGVMAAVRRRRSGNTKFFLCRIASRGAAVKINPDQNTRLKYLDRGVFAFIETRTRTARKPR